MTFLCLALPYSTLPVRSSAPSPAVEASTGEAPSGEKSGLTLSADAAAFTPGSGGDDDEASPQGKGSAAAAASPGSDATGEKGEKSGNILISMLFGANNNEEGAESQDSAEGSLGPPPPFDAEHGAKAEAAAAAAAAAEAEKEKDSQSLFERVAHAVGLLPSDDEGEAVAAGSN